MPNIPTVSYLPNQAPPVGKSFSAGQAGSIVLPASASQQTVCTGVIVSCGFSTTTVHGIWTISDGVWTLDFYVLMSPTIPGWFPLPFNPGLYSTNVNSPITIAMPAIASGSPYALSAVGYYL